MYLERNETRSRNSFCRGKVISRLLHIYQCASAFACVRMPGSVGVCMRVRAEFLFQHATRTRHIVTSLVAPLAPPFFFRHYVINGTIFEKKLLIIKCVF